MVFSKGGGSGGGGTGDYIPLSGTEVGADAGKVRMNNTLTIPDYTDKDLIPKEYADLQHSYSTNEILTGGKWIDNKDIYKITKLTASLLPTVDTMIKSTVVGGTYTEYEYTKP